MSRLTLVTTCTGRLDHLPQVKTVRVPDATEFKLGKARNLGADLCATPCIGFVDCGVLLSPDFYQVAKSLLAEKTYLRSTSPGWNVSRRWVYQYESEAIKA